MSTDYSTRARGKVESFLRTGKPEFVYNILEAREVLKTLARKSGLSEKDVEMLGNASNVGRADVHIKRMVAELRGVAPEQAPATTARPAIIVSPPRTSGSHSLAEWDTMLKTTAPARTLSDSELFALADSVLGAGFSNDIAQSSLVPTEKRRRAVMSLAFAGVRVAGLEKEMAGFASQAKLTPISSALRASRQAAADKFLSAPRMDNDRLVQLSAAVFGENELAKTLQYARTPERQREALIARLTGCQVRVASVPELANVKPGKGVTGMFQKRADEFLTNHN